MYNRTIMVKHYSSKRASNKRASKKRAYKKRRTVRKVRNMTRKIQKGGFKETWMLVVTLVVPALIAYVGGEKLQKLMSILMILSGNPQNGGGVQSGGGKSRDLLIQQLNDLKSKFVSPTDDKEINCVEQIIGKLQTKPEPAAAPEVGPAATPDISEDAQSNIIENLRQADDSKITTVPQLFEFIKTTATQVLSATKTRINAQIDSLLIKIKSRYGFDDSDMECFRVLKNKLLSDFTNKIGSGLDKVKESQAVQNAMKLAAAAAGVAGAAKAAFSVGFGAAKDAFRANPTAQRVLTEGSQRLDNFMSANPKFAEGTEKAKATFSQGKEQAKALFSKLGSFGGW